MIRYRLPLAHYSSALALMTLAGLLHCSAGTVLNEATSPSGETPPSEGSSAADPNAAHVLTKQPSAPMAQLKSKAPARLAVQFDHIEASSGSFNLQPQLLVAVAMEESTGGSDENAYANGGGMFQFTDLDTWRTYGTSNPDDRQDDSKSVKAAAYYLASMLNDNSGDLAAALRAYNGPIAQGGNPNYITEIYDKMAGDI